MKHSSLGYLRLYFAHLYRTIHLSIQANNFRHQLTNLDINHISHSFTMHLLRAFFFFATAVRSAAILPDAASGAPTLPEHEPINELAAVDVDHLFSRQQPVCLDLNALAHYRPGRNRQSIQRTIANHARHEYNFGDEITVTIDARHLREDHRMIGVQINNRNGPMSGGRIVLVNYHWGWAWSRERYEIQLQGRHMSTNSDCPRIINFDGNWYMDYYH